MNISSFGEDEQGEIYVVNLGGTVSRIVSAAPCTYAIDPTSRAVGSDGGSGNVTVTAGTGCGWTAFANAAWLRVTSGSGGSGNGAVGYAVDANTEASARTGTLTIAGQTFTVDQSAPPPCTYAISPTSATFSRVGGMAGVTVATAAGCAWSAASNAWWITVGASGGTGPGSVTYTVSPYTGKPKNRNGTMTIAGQTFSVKQSK
jgi:hypothetical protein